MNDLIRLLGERDDGYWELLATATGREAASQRTLGGLASAALAAGFDGPAASPSLVGQRVEAVAALDSSLLVGLSKTWLPPEDISLDLMDPLADFWTAAWSSALRHLAKHPNSRSATGAASVPRPIALERAVLDAAPAAPLRTFEALLAVVADAACTWDDLRRLDSSDVQLPAPIDQAQVEALLGGDRRAAGPDFSRLRILLPRPDILGEGARRWLRAQLQHRWATFEMPPTGDGGLLVLLQLVLAFEPVTEAPADLVQRFAQVLRSHGRPAQWAPFAYVLLRRGWGVP